jgi:large subunit ribosomal protein L30
VAELRITQVRSSIGRPPKQRGTLRALGLKRIDHTVVKEDRPEIRGMLAVVSHLVRVEEVEAAKPRRKSRARSGEGD